MSQLFVHGGVSGTTKPPADLSYAFGAARDDDAALDLVERAIRRLEDDPSLNAGTGSVLNREGRLELDAGIATGDGRTGGVAGVQVKNPITLARKVMDETPHVLLAGDGAAELATGLEGLSGPTPAQHSRWEAARDAGDLAPETYGSPEFVDTVGAVALDADGGLAAGSSTGGVFGKMPGRVGDAPIFGAGIYASAAVAVVGTGVGELFLETLAAARAGLLVERGRGPQDACEETIAFLGTRSPLAAGLLALGADGAVGAAFRGGSWAVAGADGPLSPVRLD